MLILTRKKGEGIAIGDDVKVVVIQIKGKQVRIGVNAKSSTMVHREEVYQKICEENKAAANLTIEKLDAVQSAVYSNDKNND